MGGAKRQSGEKWAGKGMGMREKEREVFDMGSRGTEDIQRVKAGRARIHLSALAGSPMASALTEAHTAAIHSLMSTLAARASGT